MSFYNSIEQHLPEMTEVRAQYNVYLKENGLSKTAEEKLFDYLALIAKAYAFNKEKMMTEFSAPKIDDTIQNADAGYLIYGVVTPLSERMRYYKMQDCAKFSSFVTREIFQEKDNITIDPQYAWLYKRFPAHEKLSQKDRPDIVRYALNVKPNVGLFDKLDDLCLKYDAFDYKIIDEKIYNHRTDPVIIYAQKDRQKEMFEELEKAIRPYRRKDRYDMAGYTNLENGIFVADEVKKEQMVQLKYNILTKDERDVFIHPTENKSEQSAREEAVILSAVEHNSVKCALMSWILDNERDYALSSAQYQATKMIVDAYNKTHENGLLKVKTDQMAK